MNSDLQDFDYDNLIAGIQELLDNTIGTRLLDEYQLYHELAVQFKNRVELYKENVSKAKKNNSFQALLFENAKFGDSVFSMLEETIEEKQSSEFIETLQSFFVQAYQKMEMIPETDEVAEHINKVNPKFNTKKSLVNSLLNKHVKPLSKLKLRQEESGSQVDDIQFYRYFKNRNFFFYFFIIKNLDDQIKHYEAFLSNVLSLLNYLWNFDQKRVELFGQLAAGHNDAKTWPDLDDSLSDVDNLLLTIDESRKQIMDSLSDSVAEIQERYKNGKSIESETYVKNINIKKSRDRLTIHLNETREKWYNTIFLLSEDWKLDLEIHSFRFYILKEYFDFSNVIHTKFTDPVEQTIELMNTALNDLKTEFEATKKNATSDFEKRLTKLKIDFKRKFVLKLMPVLKETINKADIPRAIDSIESDSEKRYDEISNKRYLIKNPEYNRPINRSEFESISPLELVGYEIMPGLKKVFPSLKTAFINHVQTFEKKVKEIPEIVDFNIESSISFFEKEKKSDEALKIGAEGIERAENKLQDLTNLQQSFIQQEVETLKDSIEQFITEITAIANNESAHQIKVRVARLKAIEKSKAIRMKIFDRIRNFIPIGIEYTKKVILFLRQSSLKISKQFATEETTQFITSDTSHFLSATEKAINQLPYIYQKLFQNEPLSSFELYVGRAKPMDELLTAYKKWKEGKFAPTAIIGEKGSGKTTIINRFLKTKIQNEKVIFFNLHEENKSPQEIYLEIEEQVIKKTNLKDHDEEKDRNTILIIDGLSRLFSTEINGFSFLIKTMKLITETHSRIFWIISSHLYSWNYIDKSFNISDYFGYHIKLTDLATDDLRQIIEKRHNISGYRLVYEQPIAKKSIVYIKKLKSESSQEELESAYFKSLTAFNKNNLSQAFLYWLRSTSKVENDVIHIRQINEMDSSFVKAISQPKLIILRNILIHNGVTVESHSKIFGQEVEMGKLYLDQMRDDGLLIKNQDFYLVNPLIYSQVVNELYLQNLLH
jgi:hypothetical protein